VSGCHGCSQQITAHAPSPTSPLANSTTATKISALSARQVLLMRIAGPAQ
jgi:hypothetical protein